VHQGDLLVRAADRELTTADDLFAVLDTASVTEPLVLVVVRGAEELTLFANFSRPAES
jgi:hypothetical protein